MMYVSWDTIPWRWIVWSPKFCPINRKISRCLSLQCFYGLSYVSEAITICEKEVLVKFENLGCSFSICWLILATVVCFAWSGDSSLPICSCPGLHFAHVQNIWKLRLPVRYFESLTNLFSWDPNHEEVQVGIKCWAKHSIFHGTIKCFLQNVCLESQHLELILAVSVTHQLIEGQLWPYQSLSVQSTPFVGRWQCVGLFPTVENIFPSHVPTFLFNDNVT